MPGSGQGEKDRKEGRRRRVSLSNGAAEGMRPCGGQKVGESATLSPQPHRGGGPDGTAEGSNPAPVAQEATGAPFTGGGLSIAEKPIGKKGKLGLRGERAGGEERRTVDWEGGGGCGSQGRSRSPRLGPAVGAAGRGGERLL